MKYDIAIDVEIFGDCLVFLAHDSLIPDTNASCPISVHAMPLSSGIRHYIFWEKSYFNEASKLLTYI